MVVIRLLPLALVLSLTACKPGDRGASTPTPAAETPTTTPAPASAAKPGIPTTHWQCGDLNIATRFNEKLDGIAVMFSGRMLELQEAEAEDGARFIDQAGNEFWSKGRDVTLTLAGKAKQACTKTRQPSPWNDAAARGVAYRFVGSEPGWFAEVSSGAESAFSATLDYGERKIEVARMQALGGNDLGYKGTAADGTPVVLLIEKKPCADGMSGEEFEATAKLKIGEQTYPGCGAFLGD